MTTAGRAAVFVAAAVCLAACGGGGTGPAAPTTVTPAATASPAAAAKSAPNGTATLKLVFPPTFQTATKATSSDARTGTAHPAYVNPSPGAPLRVWVDTVEITGSPFLISATADGTQTLTVPITSGANNVVDAVEYASNGTTILALGESGNNYFSTPGSALQITLTMQMNVTQLAVTVNSNGSNGVIITPSGGNILVGPAVCSPTASNVFYLYSADPLGGYVTAAGYGGTVLPTISSFGTPPSTTIVTPAGSLPPAGQYNISFDTAEDAITLYASSGNPAYTLLSNSYYNNPDLYYLTNYSGSITYSSVVTVPAPPIMGSATLSAKCV